MLEHTNAPPERMVPPATRPPTGHTQIVDLPARGTRTAGSCRLSVLPWSRLAAKGDGEGAAAAPASFCCRLAAKLPPCTVQVVFTLDS